MARRQRDPSFSELQVAKAIGRALGCWFGTSGRDLPWRHWRDEYRLAVAEVLLQRTKATTVSSFIGGFLDRYPDAEALATADVTELELALKPIGMQRRRGSALKGLADSLITRPGLSWEERPGIGQYIARAIAVGASNESLAMVDTNFVRILHRAFHGPWMADYRYDRRLQGLAAAVIDAGQDSRSVNWAVFDLGASICRPHDPRCLECPIQRSCVTGRATTARSVWMQLESTQS
jgi:A/G-specific adenine glycosylase